MDPRLVQQVDAILEQALALPVAQRQDFLDRTCNDQAEIRELVEVLLKTAQQVLEDGADTTAISAAETAQRFDVDAFQQDLTHLLQQQDWCGADLGPYRLEQLAGQGGMGQVYRARRVDGYFEQQVAVKVLPPLSPLLIADARQRFSREMRMLGQLKHPHIAQIHDAGVSPEGTAYFVMEWVDGQTITQCCQQQQLSLAQRLQLWLQVVDAVQTAHQRLIVHRDLKPANIFVDARAGVKVLDFGIAQSLHESHDQLLSANNTQHATEYAYTRWFSRQYASPEQIQQQVIGTASDQYQLGLLLYELICGKAWLDDAHGETHRSADVLSLAYLRAQIQETRSGAEADRAIPDPQGLSSDLVLVIQRMLQVCVEHRYPSLGAVAEDINACREHRPISSRRGQGLYLLRCFIRRHWLPLSAATAIFALVVTFSVHALTQARTIAAEQQRTLTELRRNEKMLQFLYRLFDDSDPYAQGEVSLSAEDIIRRGLARARQQFVDDPLTQAQVLGRMSMTLSHLGEDQQALPELLAAFELLEQQSAAPALELGTLADYLGRTYIYADDLKAAEQWLQRALLLLRTAVQQDASSDAVDQLAITYNDLGRVYDLSGQPTSQAEAYHAAQMLERDYPGRVYATTRALTLHNLAVLDVDNEHRLALEKQVLAIRIAELGADHASVLHTRMIIATLEGMLGHVAEAAAQFEVALPQQERILGTDHRDRAIQLTHYSRQLIRLNRFAEAVATAREALRINQLQRSDDSLYTIFARMVLAEALLMHGETAQAREQAEAILPYASDKNHGAYRYCLSTHGLMAETALLHGAEEEAQAHLQHCDIAWFSEQIRALPYLKAHYVLAGVLALRAGHYTQAESLVDELADLQSQFSANAELDDEFHDWRWNELELIKQLAAHYRHAQDTPDYRVSASQTDALREQFEALSAELGPQHWKVHLYEPLVAPILLQQVYPQLSAPTAS